VFARLLTFPNVIITGHQAFFTREALLNIAAKTIDNITRLENISRSRSWQVSPEGSNRSDDCKSGGFCFAKNCVAVCAADARRMLFSRRIL
jgi:hypothetical protein